MTIQGNNNGEVSCIYNDAYKERSHANSTGEGMGKAYHAMPMARVWIYMYVCILHFYLL